MLIDTAGSAAHCGCRLGHIVHVQDSPDVGSFLHNGILTQSVPVSQVLFKEAVAAPGANVHQLTLLDQASSTLVLDTFNSTQGTFPESSCIHELFEAQADTNPTAPCIRYKGMPTLSYKSVDTRANQLAHLLIKMGINKEDTVAILFERCPELVSSLQMHVCLPLHINLCFVKGV